MIDSHKKKLKFDNTNKNIRRGGLWDGETRHQAGSIWDQRGLSPTLDTAMGGGRMPHIIVKK